MTTATQPIDLTGITARRKADRERIAAEFTRIAESFGATVLCNEYPAHKGWSGPEICLRFALNGVGAQVSISDLHERHGDAGGLISWYNVALRGVVYRAADVVGIPTSRHFTPGFNAAVGDRTYARPHHKATSIGPWDVLAARLQAGLRHAFRGTAFVPAEED